MLKRQKDQHLQRPGYMWERQISGERQATEEGPDQMVEELTGLTKESELHSMGKGELLMI